MPPKKQNKGKQTKPKQKQAPKPKTNKPAQPKPKQRPDRQSTVPNSNRVDYEILITELQEQLQQYNPENPIKFLISYLTDNYDQLLEKQQQFRFASVSNSTRSENGFGNSNLTLDSLPTEILDKILEYLPVKSVVNLSKTSKSLYLLASSNHYWKNAYQKLPKAEPLQFCPENLDCWKIKYIETTTGISSYFGSSYDKFFFEGTVLDISPPPPDAGFKYSLLTVHIDKPLFCKLDKLPENWKGTVQTPQVSTYSTSDCAVGQKFLFSAREVSNVYSHEKTALELLLGAPVLEIHNASPFGKRADVLLSTNICASQRKKFATQHVFARTETRWTDLVQSLRTEYGLEQYQAAKCSECNQTIQNSYFFVSRSETYLCTYCKAAEIRAVPVDKSAFPIESESGVNLPVAVLEKVVEAVRSFVVAKLQEIFAKIEIDFLFKKSKWVSSTSLSVYVFKVQFAVEAHESFAPDAVSRLFIYMHPDGVLRSFTVVGDIRKECCVPNSRRYYIGNGGKEYAPVLERDFAIRFCHVSYSDVCLGLASGCRGNEWTSIVTFSVGPKKLEFSGVGHSGGFIPLSFINNWQHTRHFAENYHFHPDVSEYNI
jgi:hypothetical protein